MSPPPQPIANVAHRSISVGEVRLHVAEAGAGPVVVLLHGFPELWYSWRHQLQAIADAGYHAVAPDLRGYGDSDAPQPVEAYRMIELIEDVRGLLDALGAERAVLVGHDWGARIAWHTAQRHPERIIALAALGVPPTPREPQRPTDMIRRFAAGAFNFALYFNSQESLRPNSRPIPAIRCAASSTRSPETRRPNSFRTCLQPNPQTVEH